ncbi:Fic family protein [Oryzihumus sp.]
MPGPADSLAALAALPGVDEATTAAREACTELRWHQALRRRIPEAAAESRVRGARASAALEGAEVDVAVVRDLMRGALAWPTEPDPLEQVLRGVVQATAETEHVRGLVGSAPLQALARLHVAAAAGLVAPEQLGRPRQPGEGCAELVDLGAAPDAEVVSARLAGLVELLTALDSAPAVIVAALVHAEIAVVRPFVRGNGAVARAMERAVDQARGLDSTGVAVPEAGHGAQGGAAYLGALTAYGTGSREGVALWLKHCAQAVVTGAREGQRVADAVLAGRLG